MKWNPSPFDPLFSWLNIRGVGLHVISNLGSPEKIKWLFILLYSHFANFYHKWVVNFIKRFLSSHLQRWLYGFSFLLYYTFINCSHLKAESQRHCPGSVLPPGDWGKEPSFTLPSILAPFYYPSSPSQSGISHSCSHATFPLPFQHHSIYFWHMHTYNFPSSHSISSSLLPSSVCLRSIPHLPFSITLSIFESNGDFPYGLYGKQSAFIYSTSVQCSNEQDRHGPFTHRAYVLLGKTNKNYINIIAM